MLARASWLPFALAAIAAACSSASPAPAVKSSTGGPCTGDADCAENGLCANGACRVACLGQQACPSGTTCAPAAPDGGPCYHQPGCNPPPPRVVCPLLCYGYCR